MKKILILPYHLGEGLKELDYISEGILEELIFLISSNPNCRTTTRTTSLYLKDNPIPLNEIKERFNVDVVVEGNVKKQEGHYLITTRLFETETEELLLHSQSTFQLEKWTQPLDQLVSEILLTLDGSTLPSSSTQKDVSKARELYQRGLYHWHRYSKEEMYLAIGYFKKSIKENKSFALPHAGLADCYWVIAAMGYDQPLKVWKLAKESVKRALVLNNKRSESYVSAAFVNMFYERDFDKAKVNLVQALQLNSDNVKAHHALTTYYIHKGDFKNAEKYALLTIKLDPFALPHYTMIIRLQLYQKKFQVARDYINVAWSIDPEALSLYELRGLTNLYIGATESAIEDFTRCIDKGPDYPVYFANLAYAYSKANFQKESSDIEQKLHDLAINKDTGLYDYALALIKLGQSDYDSFYKYLNKAVETNIGFLPGELKCNIMFGELRKDPRFQKIMEKCKLVDDHQTHTNDRKPSQIITLNSNTSETHSFDPQDLSFIESSDNYATLYWHEAGILKKKVLRTTLKDIEEQLSSFDYLHRCHKSFIINLNEDLIITGNAKGHFFESQYLPIRVPISRYKSKLMKDLLESTEK